MTQLHETLNLYISPTAYIFEPASSSAGHAGVDGALYADEKDVRESMAVDRQTGQISLSSEW